MKPNEMLYYFVRVLNMFRTQWKLVTCSLDTEDDVISDCVYSLNACVRRGPIGEPVIIIM